MTHTLNYDTLISRINAVLARKGERLREVEPLSRSSGEGQFFIEKVAEPAVVRQVDDLAGLAEEMDLIGRDESVTQH